MKRRFTPEEEKYIIYRRQVLEAEGKNDRRIGIIIAKERGWSEESTIGKIWKFVRVGKLKENKNKHKHNSKQTREAILTGLKDAADAMEQFGDVG